MFYLTSVSWDCPHNVLKELHYKYKRTFEKKTIVDLLIDFIQQTILLYERSHESHSTNDLIERTLS